jgi:hypothetical protein
VLVPPPDVPDVPVPPVVPAAGVPLPDVPPDDVPPVAAPEVPDPDVPDDAVPDPDVPDDDVLGVTAVPPDDDGLVELGDVLVGEDEVASSEVVELLADADPEPSDVLCGAISSAVVFGTTSCCVLLPPQADSPPLARSIKAMAAARRRTGKAPVSRRRGPRGAPCAGRRSGSR